MIERILRRLHLVEQFKDFTLTRIGSLILVLCLFDNLVSQLAVSAHELVSHVLKLLFFSLQLLLDLLVALFALKNELSQVEPRIDVGLL